MSRSERSMASAAFFDRLAGEVARSGSARARLAREQMTAVSEVEREERAFEVETRRLERWLREVLGAESCRG